MNHDFKIPVLYKDEQIIVIDKPVGLPVHKNDFMPNDAPYLTKLVGDITGKWIFNVHRLDSKTSGVIVLTFSSEMAHELALQFERKEVMKKYMAIVEGNPGDGTFNDKVLVKKKSKFKKPAVTHFRTLKSFSTGIEHKDSESVVLSLVEIQPETGRWHQLRQHFAKHRHDILGDTHHGDFKLNKTISETTGIKRLFLHATELQFKHPESGEILKINSILPTDFENVFNVFEKS